MEQDQETWSRDELVRYNRELLAMNHIATALGQMADLEGALQSALSAALEQTGSR